MGISPPTAKGTNGSNIARKNRSKIMWKRIVKLFSDKEKTIKKVLVIIILHGCLFQSLGAKTRARADNKRKLLRRWIVHFCNMQWMKDKKKTLCTIILHKEHRQSFMLLLKYPTKNARGTWKSLCRILITKGKKLQELKGFDVQISKKVRLMFSCCDITSKLFFPINSRIRFMCGHVKAKMPYKDAVCVENVQWKDVIKYCKQDEAIV